MARASGSPAGCAARIAVANCITGPSELAGWIVDECHDVLATLDGVGGCHSAHLRRLVPSGPSCTYVSLTIWDSIDAFRRWRRSRVFTSAHRARTDRTRFARLDAPRRYEFRIRGEPDLVALDELVLAGFREAGRLWLAEDSHFVDVLDDPPRVVSAPSASSGRVIVRSRLNARMRLARLRAADVR
jgi:heme-degrading monooxygenase HmoA